MFFRKTLYLAAALAFFPFQAQAAQSFDQWKSELRRDALSQGISARTFDAAMAGAKPIPRIIELDRKQPEGTISFAKYYSNVITQDRINKGRAMYSKHRAELERASRKYGVPPQYIVALWGIETSYGRVTGGYKVPHALATLAHDGRRSKFFRGELINALKILDAGHISVANMKGSWAGAMGQNQFMPSSFNTFAVDGNNDGKRNIWTSLPDVFASSANYLSKSGWKYDERWGREVKVPKGVSSSLADLKVKKPLQAWKNMGITTKWGSPLPVVAGMEASLVAPDGLTGRTFLVYDNYRVIMKWNKSTYFATSVGLLANEIVRNQ